MPDPFKTFQNISKPANPASEKGLSGGIWDRAGDSSSETFFRHRTGAVNGALFATFQFQVGEPLQGGRGGRARARNCRLRQLTVSVVPILTSAAASVLEKLRTRLDEPPSWELRRELIENLVERVRVDTREVKGNRVATITVTYRLSPCPTIHPQVHKAAGSLPDTAPQFELRIEKTGEGKRVA